MEWSQKLPNEILIVSDVYEKMSFVKSAFQTRLADEHLKAILLARCSNSIANIDDSVKTKHQFHKSYKPFPSLFKRFGYMRTTF